MPNIHPYYLLCAALDDSRHFATNGRGDRFSLFLSVIAFLYSK